MRSNVLFLLSRVVLSLLILLTIGVSTLMPTRTLAQPGKLPVPCKLESSPAVYLVIEGTRRHIADWVTFLNLGYQTADIVPCGEAANYPEGDWINRLVKGSSAEVYWMEKGFRRHIPDMETFTALGFQDHQVTVLPDAIVTLWPLGKPLKSYQDLAAVAEQVSIGQYTIQLIQDNLYLRHAVISAPDRPSVNVPAIYAIGKLPAVDVTGEGDPDVLFLRNNTLLSFGYGTVVYNLGVEPKPVLDITQEYKMLDDTGRGEFKDLNSDGSYEFITMAAVNAGWVPAPCILTHIPVVLQYNPTHQRYESANREFPGFYDPIIAADWAKPETQCRAVITLVYLDRTTEAKALFDRLYPGSDSAMWPGLVENVKQARYYAAGS